MQSILNPSVDSISTESELARPRPPAGPGRDRDALVKKVIAIAAQILSKEGTEALTVRRVAQESGASTQLIYTLFGGKFGLINGLYIEGFHRMTEFMRLREDHTDPRKNIENLIYAYRDFAKTHVAFFTVMFTRPIPEFRPPQESLNLAWSSFQIFIRAVERVQTQGFLLGDPIFIGRKIWTSIHGIVSLELIGHLRDHAGDKIYDELISDLWTDKSSHGL